MEKIKLLLYCTKQKPKLMKSCRGKYGIEKDFKYITDNAIVFNGKIVAECDYEVEEIKLSKEDNDTMFTNTLSEEDLLKKSCLEGYELCNYLYDNLWCGQKGYAIHIKNLNIFNEARELNNYLKYTKDSILNGGSYLTPIKNAPQNMMYCYDKNTGKKYILISICPKWLCKICNKEQTILVRKKVLKEML